MINNEWFFCDDFRRNLSDDDEIITLASYYHQILNSILNNLTSSYKPVSSLKDDSFAYLKLAILK
jgi:hypothetical protein